MGIIEIHNDFNKYRFFYAVATYKSFSKAAKNLLISQPAISHSIKELEENLNTKLFIRNTKNVELTEDGEKLLYYVKEAFENLLMGEKLLQEKTDDLTGIIRIGIYPHIANIILPTIIKDFKDKYPNTKFNIYSTSHIEMIEKLRNKELYILIMQYPIFLNDEYCKEDVLCELDTCFYGNKRYYDMYLESSSFETFPIMLPTKGFSDINSLEETIKSHNLKLKNNFVVYSTELRKQFAIQGLGVGWGIKKYIEKELNEKILYEVPIEFDSPKSKFSIAYDKHFIDKTTSTFIKFLKDNINNI